MQCKLSKTLEQISCDCFAWQKFAFVISVRQPVSRVKAHKQNKVYTETCQTIYQCHMWLGRDEGGGGLEGSGGQRTQGVNMYGADKRGGERR